MCVCDDVSIVDYVKNKKNVAVLVLLIICFFINPFPTIQKTNSLKNQN